MMEPKFSVCHRQNTCFDCDDPKCWRVGDKGADCPKYKCDNPLGIQNCDECVFINQYIEMERKRYKGEGNEGDNRAS